ncbi:MAG: UV DNA damage repair endonuclease UvsE [Pirellulales bacterium]
MTSANPRSSASLTAAKFSSCVRLGLCCQFVEQPIKFRTTTATSLARLDRPAQLAKLAALCSGNATALLQALQFCHEQGIGCFRVNSQILPAKTHPAVGYRIEELPSAEEIVGLFQQVGELARQHGIRLTFHPDQFVVLNSPKPKVLEQSLAELEYQAEVARWIGADVINIHAGGAYGDKSAALATLRRNLERLSATVRERLTLENDDRVFAPADLLPVCRAEGIPLVYDVHHHRCLPDGLTIEAATLEALETWNREPLFHLSSPLAGWQGLQPQRHHEYIDPGDWPSCWDAHLLTVEVEAKAKELAVLRLARELAGRQNQLV